MKKNLLLLFSFLLLVSCKKEAEKKHYNLSSLKKELANHPERQDSILKIVGKLYQEDKLKNSNKVWYAINVFYQMDNNSDTKKIKFLQEKFNELRPKENEIDKNFSVICNELSNLYEKRNDAPNAIRYAYIGLEEALKKKKKYGLESSNLEFSYFNLGNAYRLAGDFENYKKNMFLSLKTSTYDDSKAFIFHNLGDYFIDVNKDSAYYYTLKGKENYIKHNNKIGDADLRCNLATLYYQDGLYQKAKDELNPEILKILKENDYLKSTEFVLLSKIELHLNNISKAKEYANQSLLYVENDEDKIRSYAALKNIALQQKDYKMAMQFSDSVLQFNEKKYGLALIEKTKELEKGFYLKQKNSKIKELEIKNEASTQKNRIIVIGSAALLALLGIFYYYFNKNQKLKSENKRNLLEQKLFASQMSPHFIFNALSAIQAEILSNNAKQANAYLAKFGQLLQNILANTFQEYVSISSEYNNLINYIDLQKMRYKNFDYTLEVYEGIKTDEDEIPPMLLQPLVENAIEHGIKTLQNGQIIISIKKNNTQLFCQIIDNGVGLNSSSKSNSISTSLIKKRLNYLSKKTNQTALFEIKNNTTAGVSSTIEIPYKTKF